MALTDAKVPNASVDVVGVYDDQFRQVFVSARPIKAAVDEDSKAMEHPVENGTTITDHIIFLPVGIELSMILTAAEYRNTYAQIKQVFRAAKLLTVQTRTSSYSNMLITSIPHEEDPDMFDVIALAFKTREVQIRTARFGTLPATKVRNKTNASTVQKGQQQTQENNSILYDWLGP